MGMDVICTTGIGCQTAVSRKESLIAEKGSRRRDPGELLLLRESYEAKREIHHRLLSIHTL